jgi:septum formation protein
MSDGLEQIRLPGRLLLGSTSRYRRELLNRLRVPFDVASPEVDEAPHPGESPSALASRLAHTKAAALLDGHPDAWILGSDQVAAMGQRILGKPGGHPQALAQLMAMSGRSVEFLTAVSVVHAQGQHIHALDITTVRFRTLDEAASQHNRKDGVDHARTFIKQVFLPFEFN